MCAQSLALRILEEVCSACDPIFSNLLKDAYLYGSYARGDYHEESDIDILLTVDMDAVEISKYRNAIAEIASALSLRYDITVSVMVKSLEEFRKYANVLPFYQNVIREGILQTIHQTRRI